jgi:orotidine-5'-phosphate decarboxylase
VKLCVALDLSSAAENLAVVSQLSGLDIWLKIGLRSFIRDGWKFVDAARRESGAKIFLDLKLYDIPNTMADSAREIADRGVEMFNIHASAGKTAMERAAAAIANSAAKPILLAVTALTSFSADEFAAVYHAEVEAAAREMALMARGAGLNGVVCSVWEARAIKAAAQKNFIALTPGIRFADGAADDQSRVATPEEAARQGADFIVMGRPIIADRDPRSAAIRALNAIKNNAH